MIPKFFFVPQIIEERKPLASTAQRAGWRGCNILYSKIPQQGKIDIITNGIVRPVEQVVEKYTRIKKLETRNISSRCLLLDVLSCVNDITTNQFCLQDVYKYIEVLQKKTSA